MAGDELPRAGHPLPLPHRPRDQRPQLERQLLVLRLPVDAVGEAGEGVDRLPPLPFGEGGDVPLEGAVLQLPGVVGLHREEGHPPLSEAPVGGLAVRRLPGGLDGVAGAEVGEPAHRLLHLRLAEGGPGGLLLGAERLAPVHPDPGEDLGAGGGDVHPPLGALVLARREALGQLLELLPVPGAVRRAHALPGQDVGVVGHGAGGHPDGQGVLLALEGQHLHRRGEVVAQLKAGLAPGEGPQVLEQAHLDVLAQDVVAHAHHVQGLAGGDQGDQLLQDGLQVAPAGDLLHRDVGVLLLEVGHDGVVGLAPHVGVAAPDVPDQVGPRVAGDGGRRGGLPGAGDSQQPRHPGGARPAPTPERAAPGASRPCLACLPWLALLCRMPPDSGPRSRGPAGTRIARPGPTVRRRVAGLAGGRSGPALALPAPVSQRAAWTVSWRKPGLEMALASCPRALTQIAPAPGAST